MKRKIRRRKKATPIRPGDLLVSKSGTTFIPVRSPMHRGVVMFFPPCDLHPGCWIRGGSIHGEEVLYDGSVRHATIKEERELKEQMLEAGVSFSFEGTALPGYQPEWETLIDEDLNPSKPKKEEPTND